MTRDYYAILGVPKSATQEEIKSAYKKLAKQHHPDLNKEAGSAEKFKEISEAASVLGNEEKRRQYDQVGHGSWEQRARTGGASADAGFDYSGFGGGFDVDDIFEMFTGGGFGSRSRGPRTQRGDDLRYDVELTLEEAATGVSRRIKLRKQVACSTCKGKGGKDVTTCTTCHGAGMVRQTRQTPFGTFQTAGACRACGGTGQQIKEPCHTCDGTGVVAEVKSIDVKIPAGVDSGTRVRVTGEGDAGPRGSAPGDLYIFITVQEHPVFTREGDDIHLDAPISFATAALGGEITVPTLGGEASIKIPKSTQTHTVFRLRGKGITSLNSGHGDLYVRVVIKTPEKLTKKQEQALKELSGDEAKLEKSLFEKLKESLR